MIFFSRTIFSRSSCVISFVIVFIFISTHSCKECISFSCSLLRSSFPCSMLPSCYFMSSISPRSCSTKIKSRFSFCYYKKRWAWLLAPLSSSIFFAIYPEEIATCSLIYRRREFISPWVVLCCLLISSSASRKRARSVYKAIFAPPEAPLPPVWLSTLGPAFCRESTSF